MFNSALMFLGVFLVGNLFLKLLLRGVLTTGTVRASKGLVLAVALVAAFLAYK